jgi:hypothetical protein
MFCLDADRNPRSLYDTVRQNGIRAAAAADAAASTYENIAATYRRMAEGPRSNEARDRLLTNAARLEQEAERERIAAKRLRERSERGGLSSS